MRLFQIFDRLVTSRIALGLVLFALLALLIWYGGPKLAIDGSEPLASQTSRLIAIAVLAVVFLGLEALRRWRLNRLNRRILSSLSSLGESSGPAGGIGRVREGYAMLCEALRTRGGARLRNRSHLYEQPWYLVLGEPGSGRCAALASSGMEFVLDAGSLARIPGSVPGRGGECGWWVTDDAVFVVAPAEFVTEPGPTQAAEWNDLLVCLKSARRRRPLNGIILTIPATCMPDGAVALDVATQMRERVQEAMAHFSMVLPIYLLVTKCDRISGFSEYFSGLDADERGRPLGVTLPLERPRPSFGRMRGTDAFAAGASAVAAYAERYRDFIASLAAWMPSRLEAEREAGRRRRIFAFPQQMQALGEPLEAIVRCIFGPSRFRLVPLFRGVFFASACQRGPTVDIVMQVHRRAWDLTVPEPHAHGPGHRVSFFLKGLFRDLIQLERGLPGHDPAVRRGRLLAAAGGFALTGISACALGGFWWLGSVDAERQSEAISEAFAAYEARRAVLPEDDFARGALTVAPLRSEPRAASDDSRDLARGEGVAGVQGWGPTILRGAARLGTHAGRHMLRIPTGLSQRMDTAYRAAAHNLVRPAVVKEIGDEVRRLAGAGDGSIDRLREVFAIYLGLADIARFDVGRLRAWTAGHVRGRYPLSPEAQTQVVAVVEDAFADLDTPQTVEEATVAAARARLLRQPPAQPIHARIRDDAKTLPEILVAGTLEERVAWVFAPADAGGPAPGVPGLFSEPGYYDHFLPGAPRAIRDHRSNDWIAGEEAVAVSDEQVFADLGALYARDYVTAWNDFLGGLALQKVSTPAQALQLMESLLSNDSPLDGLVRMVSEHTVLPLVRGSEEEAAEPGADGTATRDGALATPGDLAEEVLQRRYATWPGDAVRQAFAQYHDLHAGRTGDLPGLAGIRARIGALHAVMATVNGEPDPMQAAFGEVRRWIDDPREAEVSGLRRVVMSQPKPLRRMLIGLSDQVTAILMRSARRHLDRRWRDTVLAECRHAISDRYPIDRRAETPIAPDDFEAFFARDGTVDRFFREQMAPFVDTAGGSWGERNIHGQRLGFRDAALEMFRNAITIRRAFGLHAAALGEAGFTVEPVYLDSRAMWITVETNHRSFTYRHEPPRRFRMTLAEEAVSISMTDRTGNAHASRLNVPWAWFRTFDRHRLQSAGVPDQLDFTVDINGLEAVFRVSADSTVNPLTARTLTGFRCEETLL